MSRRTLDDGIDLVTVLYNSSGFIPMLADTIGRLKGLVRRAIIIDNRSSDGSADAAESAIPDSTVVRLGENRGFGAGNNVGLGLVRSPLVLLLNPDARIGPRSLESMRDVLLDERRAAGVQPLVRLLGWPCITTSRGVGFTRFGEGYDYRFFQCEPGPVRPGCSLVPGITCACALFRMDALASAGFFDERIFMYFEDADLSLRLGAEGHSLLLDREAVAEHHVGASSASADAMSWQLESSVLLTRRYLSPSGSGHLPGHWWRREFRILLGSLLKGRKWRWRVRAVRRGMAAPASPRSLPAGLRSLLDPDPMDMPLPHRRGGFALDADGLVIAGPGWSPTPCGSGTGVFHEYGAVELAPSAVASGLELELDAGPEVMSGSLLTADGHLLDRFILGFGPSGLRLPREAGSSVRFIVRCDDPSLASSGRGVHCLGVSAPGGKTEDRDG
jgi:N-acetylglucosaminyl-diphospho-decaprenol L-rhamnosyltransferase